MTHVYHVGVNPSFSAITFDGKYAYVTNSNNFQVTNGDSVTVLNLKKQITELTIHDPSFQSPYRIAINKDDTYAYVCNSASQTVSVIDLKKNRVSSVISGFDGPSGLVIGKQFLYVINFGAEGGVGSYNGKTVSVVDLVRNSVVASIEVDLAPQGLILSPCFKYLFVICYVDGKEGSGTLNIIDTTTRSVISKMNGFFGPFSIVLSQYRGRGRAVRALRAFVTNFGSNDFNPVGHSVSVVDIHNVYQPRMIKYIHQVGIQPSGLALSKDGEFLFVSNYNALYAHKNFQDLTYGEGTISVIRVKDLKVMASTLSVGQTPATLSLTPDGKKLLVCKFVQNTVTQVNVPEDLKDPKDPQDLMRDLFGMLSHFCVSCY